VKTQTTAQTVEVRADGEGLVSHAGAFLLAQLSDRVGLTEALSGAMAPSRERRSAHDPGRVLRDWPGEPDTPQIEEQEFPRPEYQHRPVAELRP
jgi:hypothetical protein